MWKEFFLFDLRYQLRQPLLWVMAAALATLAFLSASGTIVIGGPVGNLHLNAPVVIARQLSVLSMMSMFLVTVLIAGAILRDHEAGMADMLFATPMRKTHYLFGRFLAGFTACVALFSLATLAMMAGSHMPWIDSERVGDFALAPYAWSFAMFLVPNLLFIAALLMLLAALTRSIIMVYVGVLAFTVLWSMAAPFSTGGGSESMALLLDPFGVRPLLQATRYFTPAQANADLPAFSGALLANRMVWTAVALALFLATVALFKPQRAGALRWRKARQPAREATPAITRTVRPVAPRFARGTALRQCWQLLCFEARGVMRGLPFLIMLLLALANFIANYSIGGMRFDSIPYPLTRVILDELNQSINFVLVIVLVFYSGELMFRERQVKIADMNDAMPVAGWVPLAAKAGALVAVILAFLSVGALAGVVIQLVKGGAAVEGMLYLKGTLLNSVYFVLVAVVLLSLQAIANNKYLGYVLAILLLMSGTMMESMDVHHRLANFASLPPLVYSDLNGYGHFVAGWSWFALYWALVAVATLFLAQAFAVRGAASGWRMRLSNAKNRLKGKTGLGLAVCIAACAATGSWIHYNTTVLNHYEANGVALDRQAEYEKLYRKYLGQPNPSLAAVRANVDIYPAERRVVIDGYYVVRNKTAHEIREMALQLDTSTMTVLDKLPPHTVSLDDARHGFRVIRLAEPLAPGAELGFGFKVEVRNAGFTNSGAPDGINHNGTMFTSEQYFPKLGYVQAAEIHDRAERRKRGLGEARRMPALDDRMAQASNHWKLFGLDGDLIDFETTVSTSLDQTAIAPGYLQKTWEANGRRYFHYKMDQPVLPFFSYQSGRWDVKKASWNGMPIEVYHDSKHAYNVGSMVKGAQHALDYFSREFGPYQHRQLRITEFPLYLPYARSLPNTIPFSESLGFINDLRNPDGVDHVFYVTAHEIAHQWWGDQVIPANVQGSEMIAESLAEYSALMALEKAYGAEKTRSILRFDLDEYLAGRSSELVEEQPLFRVEGQVYIQYRKGSLVFYRLREEIGEAALNGALKRFRDDFLYKTAPYPTSRDLLRYIRAAAPANKQALITDLFERIVVYDNRVTEATAWKRTDGRWDVTMKVKLSKLEADGRGKETARAYDEPIDIAVFGATPGSVLLREKRQLPAGESTLTVTVARQPSEVGVDPYNILIDKDASDNRKVLAH